jgi:hypothetical protein
MLVTSRFPLPGVLIAAALVGCAATRGGFEDGVYHEGSIAFQIGPVPAAWKRIEVTDASLAFRDDANEASILVNAKCDPEDQDTPLGSLTAHLIMGTTEREYVVEDTVPFDAREARHTVLRAKLDGVPMGYDIYVMKKDGCTYDLVYVAAPARFDQGARAFDSFAMGFHTLRAPGTT